jgi:hypothetical protein
MELATEQRQTLNHDEIAKVARDLWQREGCQGGRDQEYWLKAEQQLLAAKSKQNCGAPSSAANLRASPAAVRPSATRPAVL